MEKRQIGIDIDGSHIDLSNLGALHNRVNNFMFNRAFNVPGSASNPACRIPLLAFDVPIATSGARSSTTCPSFSGSP